MTTGFKRTILVSAPKRSGGSLLTRLFDNHPGVIDFIDEAFFWEHAYRYHDGGLEQLFVDMFKVFSPQEIVASLIDRQMLPWVDGTYRQVAPAAFELDMKFDRAVFAATIEARQAGLASICDVWNMLVEAYALAMGYDFANSHSVFLFGGDYGRAMLTAARTLPDTRNIFIVRNPYYALESLKKSRSTRGEKVLHPINFIESLSYYYFFWENKEKILDKNTILVRYEDLLVNTEENMRRVADHVGVEFEEPADLFKEVDHQIDRHQPGKAHQEDFGVLAKDVAEENRHYS